MCLIVDECNALTAEEDITCYKAYMYFERRDEYKSPFQPYRIKKFNEVIHVHIFLDSIEENQVYFGFHTFCNEEDAKYLATYSQNQTAKTFGEYVLGCIYKMDNCQELAKIH